MGKFAGYTAPWILEFITCFVFEINIVAMASTSRTQVLFVNILKERFIKFLLVLFQKPVNSYANPGTPLMKLFPPADLLHRPFKKIADFKFQVLQLQY